jgi:hypothetical protein
MTEEKKKLEWVRPCDELPTTDLDKVVVWTNYGYKIWSFEVENKSFWERVCGECTPYDEENAFMDTEDGTEMYNWLKDE